MDCGVGMTPCPGDVDLNGCPMPEICVAEGDECPFFCPHVEHPNCGFVLSNCAGPVDAMGCEGPMTCVLVNWAEGEDCPPVPAPAPAPCPPMPPTNCGEGMTNCPGDTDPMGCPMPDDCVAEGEECQFFCPHVQHPNCGFVLSNCPGPVDAMGCEGPMTCTCTSTWPSTMPSYATHELRRRYDKLPW